MYCVLDGRLEPGLSRPVRQSRFSSVGGFRYLHSRYDPLLRRRLCGACLQDGTGRGVGTQMPIIEIGISDRISRHLAAVRLMSFMVFPDDAELRTAAEVTFRTILADWYSRTFAKQPGEEQRQVVDRISSKLGHVLPTTLRDPSAWMRNKLFSKFLKSEGGPHEAALALTDSPSAEELKDEWTRRWWPVVYTGKMMCLIGSIDQHHHKLGASLNKAIHILCKTEGTDKQRMVAFKKCGFPGVYESKLKQAWASFKPVAHLCAAYVTTETHFYQEELERDFWEYWAQAPAFYDDQVFTIFCSIAQGVERFATSFFPHGQRRPLISKDEIFALPDAVPGGSILEPRFRALTDDELAALNTYRAPKQFV